MPSALRPSAALLTAVAVLAAAGVGAAVACTSALVGAGASASGRMLLWKHRDTSAEHSFLARADADSAGMAFVGLFNGGDSLLREAWAGVNEAGFAVVNTASYNLAPDTAAAGAGARDREGLVMARALRCCRSVEAFDSLLRALPRPLGVQANFGAADAGGRGAYFEACDTGFRRFDLARPDTLLVRTNYSHSGQHPGGMGYLREQTATELLLPMAAERRVSPQALFDSVSCSFRHALLGRDPVGADPAATWLVDQDFIPRYSTGASIVIELPAPGEPPRGAVVWCALGYPPCAELMRSTLDSIAPGQAPAGPLWRSAACTRALEAKKRIFPIARGSGPRYIYLPELRRRLAEKAANR